MTADTPGDRKAEIEARLATTGRGRSRYLWLWALFAAILLGAGAWLWSGLGGGEGGVVYRTGLVERGPLRVTVTATGTVEPTNLVEISSELSGTLAEVLVDFNDRVEAGQRLARLDTTKIEAERAVARANVTAAAAQLDSAETTLTEARDDYDSAVALDERGVSSRQSLLASRAAFYRAQAAVTVARANLDLAKARLAEVEADLGKACICSPIDGVVLDRAADVGQIVASSLSAPVLFTIAEDLTEMEVQVAVDEADIGKVAEWQPAVFTVEAYDDRSFTARIRTVRYASETVDGVVSYTAVLTVDNDDLALRPGMTATAEIVVAQLDDVLTVPNAALRYAPPAAPEAGQARGGGLLGMLMPRRPDSGASPSTGRAVWVLRDGVPVEVPVTRGATDGSRTVIQDAALAAGERVVIGQEG